MTIDAYIKNMGNLIVNFQSLEFALRAFLYNTHNCKSNGKKFFNVTEGELVSENEFTNYASLGELIDKYNKVAGNNCSQIDKGRLVKIRDSLAHGRIASDSPNDNTPQKLVKYSPPKNGMVSVETYYELTEDWFKENISFVYACLKKVKQASPQ